MKICSIASGSSGNCIYIGSDDTNILIDAGISGKRVEMGLQSISMDSRRIDAILITHEHSDHIKGLGVLARRYKIPIYTTQKTWNKILEYKNIGEIDKNLYNPIVPNTDFTIKDIKIHPFQTVHDAIDPVAYTFNKSNKKISVATDLGSYNSYIIKKLLNTNILFIEANHDINMLQVGKYPYFLKKRILGDSGHLSNEMTGRLISELYHEKLSHVILGHLSNENNFPELAFESVRSELINEEHINIDKLNITVAARSSNSDLLVV